VVLEINVEVHVVVEIREGILVRHGSTSHERENWGRGERCHSRSHGGPSLLRTLFFDRVSE
jgi:hypothetical protein